MVPATAAIGHFARRSRIAIVATAHLAVASLGCGARSGLLFASSDASIEVDAAPAEVAVATDCQKQIAALDALIVNPEICTAVVRIDIATSAIAGFQIVCGFASNDGGLAAAQTRAQSDTGIPTIGCGFGQTLVASRGEHSVIAFFQPPTPGACACCGDGWFLAASADVQATLAGGTISTHSSGRFVLPSAWHPAEDAGLHCGDQPWHAITTAWDLTVPPNADGTAVSIDPDTLGPVRTALEGTALLDAYEVPVYLTTASVLEYAANVGVSRPEYLVFLDSTPGD